MADASNTHPPPEVRTERLHIYRRTLVTGLTVSFGAFVIEMGAHPTWTGLFTLVIIGAINGVESWQYARALAALQADAPPQPRQPEDRED